MRVVQDRAAQILRELQSRQRFWGHVAMMRLRDWLRKHQAAARQRVLCPSCGLNLDKFKIPPEKNYFRCPRCGYHFQRDLSVYDVETQSRYVFTVDGDKVVKIKRCR